MLDRRALREENLDDTTKSTRVIRKLFSAVYSANLGNSLHLASLVGGPENLAEFQSVNLS